jgi:GAF domain-containing protein
MPPPSPEESPRRLSRYTREVLHSAVVGVVGMWLGAAFLAVVTVVALLVWAGGSVPAWLFVAALILAVVGGVAAYRARARVQELTEADQRARVASDDVELLSDALERGDEYARHVELLLADLQRVVAGALTADLGDFINRGVLEPARDVLTQTPEDAIRLSVLVPDPDNERWMMMWSAGHTLAGEQAYNQPIRRTLSRYAFESGRPQKWDDTQEDRAFEQHEAASRPTRSMISVPLRLGDEVIGVFNVVAAVPNAFDPAEERYVAALGGVLSVAVGYFLKQDQETDS